VTLVERSLLSTILRRLRSTIHSVKSIGRNAILGIYQWYKLMSPRIELRVNKVAFDECSLPRHGTGLSCLFEPVPTYARIPCHADRPPTGPGRRTLPHRQASVLLPTRGHCPIDAPPSGRSCWALQKLFHCYELYWRAGFASGAGLVEPRERAAYDNGLGASGLVLEAAESSDNGQGLAINWWIVSSI